MQSKRRNEYFRFEFEQPIDAIFRMIEFNGIKNISKPAAAKIKNLSPKGVKLLTSLDFHLKNDDKIIVEIHFSLDKDNPTVVRGAFIWQRKELYGYSYGVRIESSKESEKHIIEELKKFSRQTVYKRKNRNGQ
ncbi:PilZ domain-containing protein [Bacillus benzoevorans]|uniref:PilZ domain-containing protein n=1 Tax=Bacillus benzoevorans TaxID=1456 RepID=A0A7X0HVZ6_9BACI|nr:PilZ domain-containing protein [Bacillus benzoevorans]MBB6447900.1 hypothetical protein [Bacillus benzoevorans]